MPRPRTGDSANQVTVQRSLVTRAASSSRSGALWERFGGVQDVRGRFEILESSGARWKVVFRCSSAPCRNSSALSRDPFGERRAQARVRDRELALARPHVARDCFERVRLDVHRLPRPRPPHLKKHGESKLLTKRPLKYTKELPKTLVNTLAQPKLDSEMCTANVLKVLYLLTWTVTRTTTASAFRALRDFLAEGLLHRAYGHSKAPIAPLDGGIGVGKAFA